MKGLFLFFKRILKRPFISKTNVKQFSKIRILTPRPKKRKIMKILTEIKKNCVEITEGRPLVEVPELILQLMREFDVSLLTKKTLVDPKFF